MMKTKIISMLCMLALLLSSNSVAVAKEKKENGSVTEAIQSADNFLTFMSKQGNEKWANCTLGEKKALFNLKNEIVAYYIEVERNNCDKGYIIISSDASYNVLEYSFDDSFIQEAKETVAENYNIDKNNQKIIYLGGIDYAINIKGCKLHASVTLHEGTHNGTDIVKEIDKDRPCHLILHNHNNYGNHSVLAVGYQKYTYKGFFRSKDQIYIRIADGWDKRPGRYVWGGCAGTWNYVSINMW